MEFGVQVGEVYFLLFVPQQVSDCKLIIKILLMAFWYVSFLVKVLAWIEAVCLHSPIQSGNNFGYGSQKIWGIENISYNKGVNTMWLF